MADRSPGARPATTWSGVLAGIVARFGKVERRVAKLEERSGQTLPADYRFETNEAGELVVRRVSTGDTTVIDV